MNLRAFFPASTCLRGATMTLIAWLGFASPCQAIVPASERVALINFYNSANGDTWLNNTGWKSASGSECSWYGVSCQTNPSDPNGAAQNVIGIDFPTANNLTGTLTPLSPFPFLKSFTVNNNALTGSIPALSSLSNLQYFSINSNQLTGPIPAIKDLGALQIFDVSINQLSGSIPELSGLPVLRSFNANFNQLSGAIPALSGLTSIEIFSVQGNALAGSIPSLNGLTTLIAFDISRNQLTGTIPRLSDLSRLAAFAAGNNRLSGSIPSLLGLSNLRSFFVQRNSLTGTLPPVPFPTNALRANSSLLCPNPLSITVDSAWDAATGSTPWSASCVGAVAPICDLDIDDDKSIRANTDGVLVLRYLLGLRGAALTSGAVNPAGLRTSATEIEPMIGAMVTSLLLDVDGNNQVTPDSDALLLLRAMLGFTGTTATNGALGTPPLARDNWPLIRNYLNATCGMSLQ